MPLLPARLSTTTWDPQLAERLFATNRPYVSAEPPTVKGTTKRTRRLGVAFRRFSISGDRAAARSSQPMNYHVRMGITAR
jgi:hypothetical protein